MNRYVKIADDQRLINVRNFKKLKFKLIKNFEDHWLKKIFSFVREAVNFNEITNNEKLFLNYKLLNSIIAYEDIKVFNFRCFYNDMCS